MISLTGIFLGVYYIMSIIIFTLVYIFSAISLYSIARRNNICAPWIAWIPIAQFYIIGKAIEEYELFKNRIPKAEYAMIIIMILGISVNLVPGFGLLLGLVVNAVKILFFHKFFYLFNPERSFVYALLCIFGSIPLAIILYMLRNENMQVSPGSYQYPF